MSEQKSLTLDEAKGRMEHIRRVAIEYNDLPRINCATDCIDLLARVEQPSEEDMAVLWLMRETGKFYSFGSSKQCWQKLTMNGIKLVAVDITPAEEARKLGWGG